MLAYRRLLLSILIGIIFAVPVIAVLNGWIGGQHWPMKRMQVSAEFTFVSQKQIRDTVTPYLAQGFFAVNLQAIRQSLQTLHWVDKVEVRKKWPDTLVIRMQEYRPLAIWNEKAMLAEQGSIFAMPKTNLPNLPRFTGHNSQAMDLLAFFQKSQPLFQSIGLQIAQLQITDRNTWRIVLSDGLIVDLGHDSAEQRLVRFVNLLPKIKREDARKLLYANLSYTNGFALSWQQAAPVIAQNPPQSNLEQVNL